MDGLEIIGKIFRLIRGAVLVAWAFLVSWEWLQYFECGILSYSSEDVLWIYLKSKSDPDYIIHLCVCYLQPERSSRGNIAQKYYDNLLSQIYLYSACSNLCICGDFNGRIGNQQDFEDKIDFVPIKTGVDDFKNKFGNYLLNFLKDTKLCVLNGRRNACNDNFTYVSTGGKSTVDYMAVPYTDLSRFSGFSVHLVSDILLDYNINPDAGAPILDHSVLSCELTISDFNSDTDTTFAKTDAYFGRRIYDVSSTPNDIL